MLLGAGIWASVMVGWCRSFHVFKRGNFEGVPEGIPPLLRLRDLIRESYAMYREYPAAAFTGQTLSVVRDKLHQFCR